MDAGKLTTLISIMKPPSGGYDAAGQPLKTPVLHKQKWAQPKTSTGMASMSQSSEEGGVGRSLVLYSYRVRYDPTINANMFFEDKGIKFNIRQVRHDLERFDWTDLVCEAGA